MSAYIRPQLTLTQTLRESVVSQRNVQRTVVIGPLARLARFGRAAERADTRVGPYDRTFSGLVPWPALEPADRPDPGFTAVHLTDALLLAFTAPGVVTADPSGTKIRTQTEGVLRLAASADGTPPSAEAGDRGVRPGDVVRVRSAGVPDRWSTVRRVAGVPVAATVGEPAADEANPGSTGKSESVAKTGGADNCILLAASASQINPLASGRLSDVYTVTVVVGSTGGDLTTARLRVRSVGGDDQDDVVPAAAGSQFSVGARGLAVILSLETGDGGQCVAAAAAAGVSANDLVVGQTWTIETTANFSPAATGSGGTYVGKSAEVLTVRVVRGGRLSGPAARPMIQVGTASGGEYGPPVVVPGAEVFVPLGQTGATIAFDGFGLLLGDRYTVEVTPAGEGSPEIFELTDATSLAATTAVNVDVFLPQPVLALPRTQPNGVAAQWAAGAGGVTLAALPLAYDPSWTVDGEQEPLPVYARVDGRTSLHLTRRYWVGADAGAVVGASQSTLATAIPGPQDPDNPLTYAAGLALANGSAEVLAAPVADPADPAAWAAALAAAGARSDAYHLVVLTDDPVVVDLARQHVTASSRPDVMLWRTLWVGIPDLRVVPLVHGGTTLPGRWTAATTADGSAPLATIDDDPAAAGTQFTRVRFNPGTVDLIGLGVRAGDTVRFAYREDAAGRPVWTERTVAAVRSATELVLTAPTDAATLVPSRTEVWRPNGAAAEAAAVAAVAAGYGDERVRAVAGDSWTAAGVRVPTYFAAAALAGLAGGVLPQQNLTRATVSGVRPSGRRFSQADLDVIAGGGGFVVDVTPAGAVFVRHAVTTADTRVLGKREEVAVRNFDSVCFRLRDQLDPYIGVFNNTPATRSRIRTDLDNLRQTLTAEGLEVAVGGQIIDLVIVTLEADPVAPDRLILSVDVVLPAPLNRIDATATLVF